MNRSDIVEAMSDKLALTKGEADLVVRTVFDEMSKALAKGNRVEIRGLCSFRVKKYKAYYGKNPKTGNLFRVKPKKLPYFKCGTDLKKRVNTVNSSPTRSDGFQPMPRGASLVGGPAAHDSRCGKTNVSPADSRYIGRHRRTCRPH